MPPFEIRFGPGIGKSPCLIIISINGAAYGVLKQMVSRNSIVCDYLI